MKNSKSEEWRFTESEKSPNFSGSFYLNWNLRPYLIISDFRNQFFIERVF